MSDAATVVQAAQDHPGGAVGIFVALIGALGVARRTESAHTKLDAQAVQLAALTKRMDDADGKLTDTVGTAVRHHVEAALPVLIPGAAMTAVRGELTARLSDAVATALSGKTLPVDAVQLERAVRLYLERTDERIESLRRDIAQMQLDLRTAQSDGVERWVELSKGLAAIDATLAAMERAG